MSESVPFAPDMRDRPSERRQVSVLFADMVGYTAVVEALGEERASALTTLLHDLLTDTIRRHGGTVKSFAGDSVMAVFGVPAAQEDAALRACRAGLAIHERLAAAAEGLAATYGTRPVMRVGVSSGAAVIAAVEGEGAAPTAIGNAVNLAARIQTLAPPGGSLICDATRALVEWVADLGFAGEQQIRGLSRPQKLWSLRAIRDAASRFDAARARGLTPLIGRAEELRQLDAALEAAGAGRAAVDIVGEPGLGKTRLAFEFLRKAAADGAVVVTGHCLADGRQTPFLPYLEALRGALGIGAADEPADIAQKIGAGLAELDLDGEGNRALLLNLLGVRGQGADLDAGDGVLIGLRTRALLRGLVVALCARARVVLMIEDVHWIDSASEDLTGALLGDETLERLMIVTTRRPEYLPPWQGRAGVTTIAPAPLGGDDIRRMVQGRLGVEDPPAALVAQVAERAGGNPLFGEEILSFLLHQGALRVFADRVEFDAAEGQTALPASVQSLLAARMDRLPAGDRALLQAAAIIGRRFDPGLLALVTDRPEETGAILERLEDGGIVRREPRSSDFAFRHVLLRDTVEQGLLSDRRAQLHLAVAQAIEARNADRIGEVVDSLAFHYGRTDRRDRAFACNAMAGARSLGVFSLDEADRSFAAALALREADPACADDAAFAAMLADYALCLNISMRVQPMFALIERVGPFLRAHGDSRAHVHVLHHYVACLICDAQFLRAREVQRELTAMARRLGDPGSLAYALVSELALCCYLAHLGPAEHEAMRAEAEAALARIGDAYISNYCRAYLCYDQLVRGRVAAANALAEAMIRGGETTDDARALGYGLAMRALIALCTDDYDVALEQADKALGVCRVEFETNIALCSRFGAIVPLGRAGADRAVANYVARCAQNSWTMMGAGPDCIYGVALVMRGRIGEGLRHIETVIARREAEGSKPFANWARLFLCEVYLAILSGEGDAPPSVLLRNAGAIARVMLFGAARIRALVDEVRADPRFDPEGHYIARAEMILGLLAKVRRRRAPAVEHLTRAHGIVAPAGASAMRRRIEAALAELGAAR